MLLLAEPHIDQHSKFYCPSLFQSSFLFCKPIRYSLEHLTPSNPAYVLLNVHCPIFYNNTQTGLEAYRRRALTLFFQGVKYFRRRLHSLPLHPQRGLWACGVCLSVRPG